MGLGGCLLVLGLLSLATFRGNPVDDRNAPLDVDRRSIRSGVQPRPLAPDEWNRSDALDEMVEISPAADALPRSGSLFCYVLTSARHHARVPAVNETWLPRCDHGQFYTNAPIEIDGQLADTIPFSTVFAGLEDKYENLFFKTIYALHYSYTHISRDFDWYFKADDDTYVVVENLREYLSHLDPNEPHFAGFRMKPSLENGYNSGGAGYVLSREAMRQFDGLLYRNTTTCPDDIYEDLGLARCLANIGIFPQDTRNSRGQQRFNGYHYNDIFGGWITNNWIFDPQITSLKAIGQDLISLHHIAPNEMRIFDRLIYIVQPAAQFREYGRKSSEETEQLRPRYVYEETNRQTKVLV
ncbi:unnamed protein product, partial [Mesorhabditis spiculigera]